MRPGCASAAAATRVSISRLSASVSPERLTMYGLPVSATFRSTSSLM